MTKGDIANNIGIFITFFLPIALIVQLFMSVTGFNLINTHMWMPLTAASTVTWYAFIALYLLGDHG